MPALMLPGESGIEVCERIRERDQSVMIVMITAKDAEGQSPRFEPAPTTT